MLFKTFRPPIYITMLFKMLFKTFRPPIYITMLFKTFRPPIYTTMLFKTFRPPIYITMLFKTFRPPIYITMLFKTFRPPIYTTMLFKTFRPPIYTTMLFKTFRPPIYITMLFKTFRPPIYTTMLFKTFFHAESKKQSMKITRQNECDSILRFEEEIHKLGSEKIARSLRRLPVLLVFLEASGDRNDKGIQRENTRNRIITGSLSSNSGGQGERIREISLPLFVYL